MVKKKVGQLKSRVKEAEEVIFMCLDCGRYMIADIPPISCNKCHRDRIVICTNFEVPKR